MTEPLTTLSAFKRALTVGSRWETRYSAMLPDPENPKRMVATVSKWQRKDVVHTHTNSVAFSINDHPDAIAAGIANPRRNGSGLWYPKAALCSFPDGAVRISQGDQHHWHEYRLLELATHAPSQPTTEQAVWAVAAYTLSGGWSLGTTNDGEEHGEFADVYASKTEAEVELADIIQDRLTQFIENPDAYGDLATALDSGFCVVPAALRPDGTLHLDGEEHGIAPPSVRNALAKSTAHSPPEQSKGKVTC